MRKIFLALIFLAFIGFSPSPAFAKIDVQIGDEQKIFDSTFPNVPDASYVTIFNNGTYFGIITGGGGRDFNTGTYFTKPGVNVLKKKLTSGDLTKPGGLQSGVAGSFDENGVWLKYIYIPAGGGQVWHGYYHAESKWTGGDVDEQSLAYVQSNNKGASWTKINYPKNEIITGYGGLNAADPSFWEDKDYIYMLYTEKVPKDNPNLNVSPLSPGGTIARASKTSNGLPGSWFKYYCNPSTKVCGFTEKGIGGKFTKVKGGSSPVAYNTYLGKYISIGQALAINTSTNGIDWESVGRAENPSRNPEGWTNWYPGLVSLTGSSVEIGQEFWFYYTKIDRASNSSKRWLYRRRIKLEKVYSSADANDDGMVSEVDLNDYWLPNYRTKFGQSVSGKAQGDFNGDGKANGQDYVLWVNEYGQ